MKRIAIITLAVALENEKGYSRFRTLAEILSSEYNVDLITSSFQHWEKRQRSISTVKNLKTAYNIFLAYEPGYKKNVDLRRVFSHRIAVKNIIKIISNNKYDLIYCIIPDNHMAAEVGKYANANNIKYIIDVEDLWPEAMEMVSPLPAEINNIIFGSYRKDAQKAYELADAFVGTSDEYRDVPKVKYNITNKPAVTVYVGCDLDEFISGINKFSNKIEKASDEFWVTYAGNLGASYDIKTLIKAEQLLFKGGYRNIRVKILGGGPLEKEFKQTAEEQDGNIDFIGYLPYEEMAAYLDKSDVLVNSFVKKAPQSIVTKIGDYLSAGKAMINTCSSNEFRNKVINDGFGLNVEAENAGLLKDAILQMYNNNEKRIEMGKKARYIAENEFDRKVSYKQIVKLIEELLGG